MQQEPSRELKPLGESGIGHDAPPISGRQRDRWTTNYDLKDADAASPFARDIPNRCWVTRTSEECGSSAAPLGGGGPSVPCRCRMSYIHTSGWGDFASAKAYFGSVKPADWASSTNRYFRRPKRLTVRSGRDYIATSGRAAALARWRVREAPHCLRGESSGQKLWPWRMYGRRRLRFMPGAWIFDGATRFRAV